MTKWVSTYQLKLTGLLGEVYMSTVIAKTSIEGFHCANLFLYVFATYAVLILGLIMQAINALMENLMENSTDQVTN